MNQSMCLSVWFQVLKVLEGHTGAVLSVAVSADGSKIVSGSYDNSVRIWSTESGQVPRINQRRACHGSVCRLLLVLVCVLV